MSKTMTKTKPITYSPPMVRARRAGLKTTTRRILSFGSMAPDSIVKVRRDDDGRWFILTRAGHEYPIKPSYQVGDVLYVREAYRLPKNRDHQKPSEVPDGVRVWYEADGPTPEGEGWGRYRHARYMMRWMSRDSDEVVGVRAERVQDISEEDALAEGVVGDCECWRCCEGDHAGECFECAGWGSYTDKDRDGTDCPHCDATGECPVCHGEQSAEKLFAALWDSINGPGAWDRNDWVWCYTFKKTDRPPSESHR